MTNRIGSPWLGGPFVCCCTEHQYYNCIPFFSPWPQVRVTFGGFEAWECCTDEMAALLNGQQLEFSPAPSVTNVGSGRWWESRYTYVPLGEYVAPLGCRFLCAHGHSPACFRRYQLHVRAVCDKTFGGPTEPKRWVYHAEVLALFFYCSGDHWYACGGPTMGRWQGIFDAYDYPEALPIYRMFPNGDIFPDGVTCEFEWDDD